MFEAVAKTAASGGFDRDIRNEAFRTLAGGISIAARKKAERDNVLLMVW